MHRNNLKFEIGGMRMVGRISLLISYFLFLISFSSSAQQWPIFRGDQQLTGTTQAALPDKPKLLFSYQTEDVIKASPVVTGQTIFCGSTDGFMYAIGFDGKLKWKFNAGNGIEAPALLINGSVLFGTLEGLFFRLDDKSGKKIWQYKTDNQIMGSANWLKTGNRISLVVGSYDYNLHAVGFVKGDSLWRYESDNYINGAPAIWTKYAVFGGCDGFLHLVNIPEGKLFKKIKLQTYVASSPLIEGNKAFVGDYEGRFFCVDLEAGKIVWTYDDPGKNLPFLASPALSGNFIVVGNQDRFIYCLDKTTGKEIWKVKASSRVESSSVIASGKVITGTMDGLLYIHDLKTGAELWKYELGSPVIGSPAVISGKIIVGAGNRIYVFGN
jgi:outer membrane protein assembly factor BamB